jgi:hypothetical protein
MNRRNFISTLALAAGATALPKFDTDPEQRYYDAFRERIIELVRDGYDVKRWELAREHDGFRLATVYVGLPGLTTRRSGIRNGDHFVEFYQPWGRNVDAKKLERENRIYEFAGCQDCGQYTNRQHRQWCPKASVLFDL